ncbi:MAG: hypothetical protein ACRDQ0_12315, partial [Pseudonocardia sp.]
MVDEVRLQRFRQGHDVRDEHCAAGVQGGDLGLDHGDLIQRGIEVGKARRPAAAVCDRRRSGRQDSGNQGCVDRVGVAPVRTYRGGVPCFVLQELGDRRLPCTRHRRQPPQLTSDATRDGFARRVRKRRRHGPEPSGIRTYVLW